MAICAANFALSEFQPLQKGSKGDSVIEIQTLLQEQGYLSGTIDGEFGNATLSAVMAFQQANGLEASGVVDEATYNALTGNVELVEIDQSRVHRITLDAGSNHVLGLTEDGRVLSVLTGKDKDWGQSEVSGWTDIISINAGAYHSVGLKSDGTVVAAGINEHGECNVKGWTGIIDVASKGNHTVGLRMDGTVVATGLNDDGQCNVSGWTDIVDVATGLSHTIGLRADGTVVAVGKNDNGQCNVSDWRDIVAIDGCYGCTVGLRSDGTLVFAGGVDTAKNTLYLAQQWRNIVNFTINDSDGYVLAVQADGSLASGEWNASNGKLVAATQTFWGNKWAYLLENGTVSSNIDGFDGVTLQLPDTYALSLEASEQIGEPADKGIWQLKAYVDEFDLPTNEYYITNSVPLTGKFSNSATTNSELKVYLYCDKRKNAAYYSSISIRLLEYGSQRVKNPFSKSKEYDITLMDDAGSKYKIEGKMYSESSDIHVLSEDAQYIVDALQKGGTVRFSITERKNELTKYIFTIDDASGFGAAYYELETGAPADAQASESGDQSGTPDVEMVQFVPSQTAQFQYSIDDWYGSDETSAQLCVLLLNDCDSLEDFVENGDMSNVYIGMYGDDCLTMLINMGEGSGAVLNYLPTLNIGTHQIGLAFTMDEAQAASLYDSMGVTDYRPIAPEVLRAAINGEDSDDSAEEGDAETAGSSGSEESLIYGIWYLKDDPAGTYMLFYEDGTGVAGAIDPTANVMTISFTWSYADNQITLSFGEDVIYDVIEDSGTTVLQYSENPARVFHK